MSVAPLRPYLEPLRRTVTVRQPLERAFDIFTAGIGRWWPRRQFSIGQEHSATCAIEPRVGGEVYEVLDDGTRHAWGRVLVWEPAQRLVVTWHPGRPADTAQEVEVHFTAVPEGTRVDLEHRNWQSYGPDAAQAREGYENGWPAVLAAFGAAAE